MILGIISLAGGVWITQDAIASILYYLGKENWHYNQAVRIVRGFIGIMFITIGIMEIY